MMVIVSAAGLGVYAHAEYAPKVEMGLYPKKEVAKGVRALRNLPAMIRQAVMADKLGLLYLPSGEYAHETSERKSRNGEELLFEVKPGARFVGSDGREYDFSLSGYQAASKNGYDMVAKNGKPTLFGNWVISREVISTTDGDPVFVSFANDITKLVRQLAKYRLKSMPAKLRMLCLADCANLLVLPGGNSAYTGELVRSTRDGSRKQLEWPQRAAGAVFYGADGEAQSADQIYAECCSREPMRRALEDVQWCAQLIGREDILALYAKDVKALQKAHMDAAERPDAGGTPEPVGGSGVASAPEVYAPTPPPISGYYPAVEQMKKLPLREREVLLAKFFHLVHVSSGEEVEPNRERPPHEKAFYFGSDGKEYNYGAELDAARGKYASEMEEILNESGAYVMYYTFAPEIQAMAAHLVRKVIGELPEELLDAWIASVDGLVYRPDKRACMAATRATGGVGVLLTRIKAYSTDALFTDSTGKEHGLEEVFRAYPDKKRHCNLLNSAIALLGRDVVLSSLAERVSHLRDQFRKACDLPLRAPETLSVTVANHPVIQALRALPERERQAYLAARFWAVCTQEGQLPSTLGNNGLQFIDTGGQVRLLQAELDHLPEMLKNTDVVYADYYLLFSAFAEEVSDMVRRMANKRLMSISKEEREGLLAEMSGILYGTKGNRVRSLYEQRGSGFKGTDMSVRVEVLPPDMAFVTTDGRVIACKDMPVFDYGKSLAPDSSARLRAQILLFASIVGYRSILASFPKAVQDLRWARDHAPKGDAAPLGTPSSGSPLGDPVKPDSSPDDGEVTAMGRRSL